MSARALGTGHSNGALVVLVEALRAWLVRPGKPYVACMDGPPVLNGHLGSPRIHLTAGSKGSTPKDSSSRVAVQGSRVNTDELILMRSP